MGLSAIFGEVPVFLGFSQKKKITIRELFPMEYVGRLQRLSVIFFAKTFGENTSFRSGQRAILFEIWVRLPPPFFKGLDLSEGPRFFFSPPALWPLLIYVIYILLYIQGGKHAASACKGGTHPPKEGSA